MTRSRDGRAAARACSAAVCAVALIVVNVVCARWPPSRTTSR
jgi:hypothetical protein